MRRVILFAMAATTIIAACTREANTSENQDEDTIFVTISFTPYQVEPFTKTAVGIAQTSKLLDVYIYEGDEEVTAIHQNKDVAEQGFGTVFASLNKTKTYSIYAVSHKGNGAVTFEDGVFSWPDNKISDTFFYSGEFTPSSGTSLSCEMNRIVGMFKLKMLDAQPEDLAKVRFVIANTGLGYDVDDGPVNPGEKVTLISNPSSGNDGSTTFNIYCLATDETETIDITVTAMDAEDEVIEEKVFEDVPIKAGYVTTFKGTFFVTTEVNYGFTADNDWNLFDEEEY